MGDPDPVSLHQVFASSTSSPPRSRPCGTRLMTTSRTWIAPPFRTSTRSCRFLFWSTSTPDPPSLQPQRRPHKYQHSNWTTFFLLMFHCSKDLQLLFCRLKEYTVFNGINATSGLSSFIFPPSPQQQDQHTGSTVCSLLHCSLYISLFNTVMRHLSVNANVWCLKEKEKEQLKA